MASEKVRGKLREWMLNMSFHGRRAPRPSLIRSLARDRYSRLAEGSEEAGIVP